MMPKALPTPINMNGSRRLLADGGAPKVRAQNRRVPLSTTFVLQEEENGGGGPKSARHL